MCKTDKNSDQNIGDIFLSILNSKQHIKKDCFEHFHPAGVLFSAYYNDFLFFLLICTALKIKSSVKDFFSMTKSAVSCGFGYGHIYWKNP